MVEFSNGDRLVDEPRDPRSLFKVARYGFYIVLACGLLYVLIPMDLPTFQTHVIQSAVRKLTILIIVALFLERALEVYKLFYFAPGKNRLETQIQQRRIELQARLSDADNSVDDNSIQAAKLRLLTAEENLQVYSNHTRQSLLQTAMGFGFLIGLVGVRALDDLINFPEPQTALELFRLYLFRILDLILTTGLIAGGSEGIHGIIKLLNGVLPDFSQIVIHLIKVIRHKSP